MAFSGNPKTEWLSDADHDDRDMRLLEDFSFTDPSGRLWWARAGAVVNGASIPPPLWSSVGSPYTGDYRRASVVHDVACDTPGVDRKAADVMFYQACLAGGCSKARAAVLYAGVRIGAWASRSLVEHAVALESAQVRQEMDLPTAEEQFMQAKLAEIQNSLALLPADADVADLDAVIRQHLPV